MYALRKHFAVLSLWCLTAPFAFAGGTPASAGLRHAPEDLAAFAKSVEQTLAQHRAFVALVARVGRPKRELPSGIRYTHVGIAVYSMLKARDGREVRGYAVHNLYQSDENPSRSTIVTDYLFDFFANAYELRSGIILLEPKLQAAMLNLISAGSLTDLHRASYSVVSNPADPRFQNCTELVLDAVHASLYQTTELEPLKRAAQKHFTPKRVSLGPFRAGLGGLLMPGFSLSDHDGPIRTATFGSIAAYLQDNGLATAVLEQGRPARLAAKARISVRKATTADP